MSQTGQRGMADLPDVDVKEMKRFLETCTGLQRWLPEPQWHPARQSEAARECANQETGPDESQGEPPARAAHCQTWVIILPDHASPVVPVHRRSRLLEPDKVRRSRFD
jgi:hypothetical protein